MTTVIRLATPADGAAFAAIYAPAVTHAATSFELEPPTGEQMASRIATVLARLPWLACERNGMVIGYAYAAIFRDRPAYAWSVEVSAYVHADARRAGVGQALYRSLFAVLVLQGFRSAYAGITQPNEASMRLHAAAGFTPVGTYHNVGFKFGRWHDVSWFERPLADHTADPAPPVWLPQVTGSGSFAQALSDGASLLR